MGNLKLQGRDGLLLVLLVVLIAACAWSLGLFGGSPGGGSDDGGSRAEAADSAQPESTDPPDGIQELIATDYDPGDCVMYSSGSAAPADTDVVPCTEEHRVQIAARTDIDIDIEGTAYPTEEEWG